MKVDEISGCGRMVSQFKTPGDECQIKKKK